MALFQPFRALGYITDDVPFAVQRRGRETYVTVSVGKSWQVYNCGKLTLSLIGPQFKHDISALACKGDLTFAAVRGAIIECKRVHRSGVYRGHAGEVVQLLPLGEHLLSLGRDGRLLFWRIGEYDEPEVSIQLPQGFAPTCMAHPDTYLNKVVVGGESGELQLWNFATGHQLYKFAGFGSAVRCIASSPALDVVGVGLADGRAVLLNLRYDETVAQYANASGAGTASEGLLSGSAARAARGAAGGAVAALAFRTGAAGQPFMAAGGGAGVVTVWDLDRRRLHAVLCDAHDAPVTRLHFFPGEPLLMSAGADNSLKQWLFDGPDASPRLLRFRAGHAAPPTVVRYYADGRRLLSAGLDRAFRAFSAVQDQQSRELSQRHVGRRAKRLRVEAAELKLPRVTALDSCEVRERDWCNVVTAHEGDPSAYTWRLAHYALGEHVLSPPAPRAPRDAAGPLPPGPAPVTAVALSRCGNFAFVGSAAGRLDRYNMQSGMHRGSYARAAALPSAHDGPVRGLAPDARNATLASAGGDGALRFWDLRRGALRGEVRAPAGVGLLVSHPATGLLAAACDDLAIRLYDVEARRLVRTFKGHGDRITDLQLSADCRWLLSGSMDNTLRVWDVPGARVLQVMRLGSPVVSLSLSPAQDLLATCHPEKRGVYLWANQQLFGGGADLVASERPVAVRLPAVAQEAGAPGGERGADGRRTSLPAMLAHTPGAAARHGGASGDEEEGGGTPSDLADHSDSESESGMESDVTSCSGGEEEGVSAEAPPPGQGRYAALGPGGGPLPLAPELVTLSMLPRSQWQGLIHLDVIKARNKPIEPAKKPVAAPFFLPTLAGADAGRQPVFAAPGDDAPDADAAVAAAAAAAWGGGESSGEDEPPAAAVRPTPRVGSRVVRGGAAATAPCELSRLLRACASSSATGVERWAPVLAHVRGLPPAKLDTELHQLGGPAVAADDPAAAAKAQADLGTLLRFLSDQLEAGAEFELVQAVLRVALRAHGDAVAGSPALRAQAAGLGCALRGSWMRLGDLLQGVRCMVGVLGRTQG